MKRKHSTPLYIINLIAFRLALIVGTESIFAEPEFQRGEANLMVEIPFTAARPHDDPFKNVDLEVVFIDPTGTQKSVPAFWAGGKTWKVRYASALAGMHHYRTQCSDAEDAGLHAIKGEVEINPYTGTNPLYRHGPIRVAADHRHCEHLDGTPFFWLGDTWWKGLCKRMTWEGFQELTADRKAKGFSVVQIVCGVYPDEGLFEPRWENEAGKPYETRDFSVVNPAYFEYSDRRLQHLVNAGIVPAIVGGWGARGLQRDGNGGGRRHQAALAESDCTVWRLPRDLDYWRRVRRTGVDRGGRLRAKDRSVSPSGDHPSLQFSPTVGH